MKRKLAHIEEIIDLQSIVGADKIEVATVLGWRCVVKKNEFKIGEKVIYIEVDSIVPDVPQFEFLRDRKFRVRTIKLRKQISQGLVVPIPKDFISMQDVGTDVTEFMGIKKHLSPSEQTELQQIKQEIKLEKNKLKKFMLRYSWFRRLFLTKREKQKFPYWVSKTDEERIQNIPHVLKQFKDKEVYITEKIDYQSVTFTGKTIPKFQGIFGKLPFKEFKFVVCSRSLTTNDPNSLYLKIAKKYNIEQILKENPTLTIQGEQGDTKVQGNKYKLSLPEMWVFNIIDHSRAEKYYYNYIEMNDFCIKYNLPIVPILYEGKLQNVGCTVDDIVKYSEGKSIINKNIQREGIVIRCIKNGKKLLSFKAINPKFLLKYS